MGSKNILNICLKVVGIFYALKALNMLPTTITQLIISWDAWKYVTEDDPMDLIINYRLASVMSILIPILLFIISVIIIFQSEKIVNFITKKETGSDISFPETFSFNVLDISIRIFGFFSFLSAIPHLSKLLSRYLIMKEQIKLYNDTVKIELASSGIAAILYIAIGLLLIFNSNQLSEKLSKIGVSKKSHIESEK